MESSKEDKLANLNFCFEKEFYYAGALEKFDYNYLLKNFRELLEAKKEIENTLKAEKFQSLPNNISELDKVLKLASQSDVLDSQILIKTVLEKQELIRLLLNKEKALEKELEDGIKDDFMATPVHLQSMNAYDNDQIHNSWFEIVTKEYINHPLSNYSILLVLGAEAMTEDIEEF